MRNQRQQPRRRIREPEFGDWRVPVAKPHEVEHMKPTPVSVVRRWCVQAADWQTRQPVYSLDDLDAWEPIHGTRRIIRLAVACCLLLPLSVIMVFALFLQLYHAAPLVGTFDFWQSVPVWFAVLGVLLFISVKYFQLIDPILLFTYVAGHEMTHALATMLCFGKVQAMSVKLEGGYVDTDKDNLFISLSPYFIPLWMLVWLGLFSLANWIFPFDDYLAWFYAGFGFWWAFHVYWTLWIIPREQPDLLENGVVISFLIILLANIAALVLMLRCFGVISLSGYARDFVTCAVDIYSTYHDLVLYLFHLI